MAEAKEKLPFRQLNVARHAYWGPASKEVLSVAIVLFLVTSSFVSFGLSSVSASPTAPGGILHYVPITITNSQLVATPAPFQEMVTVNSAAYQTYEASNLMNVEFFNADGSIISSWLESGNSNSASSTIFWLNLPNGIAAASSATVFMGFASTSTNLLNGLTTGEAPELSGTYGQYDNGPRVFPLLYANFAGTAVPSSWSTSGSITVDNGVHVPGGTDSIQTNANYGLNPEQILDFYGSATTAGLGDGSGEGAGYSVIPPTNSGYVGFQFNGCNRGSGTGDFAEGTEGTICYQTNGTNEVLTAYTPSTASSSFSNNYGPTDILSHGLPSPSPIAFFSTFGGNSGTINVYWVRLRAYPPNAAMPSAVFGTAVSTSTTTSATTSSTSTTSAVTYSSDTTLAADVFCTDLTINSGVTLTTNGYNIYCLGAFTNAGRIVTGFPDNGGTGHSTQGGSVPSSHGGSGAAGETSINTLGGVGGSTLALGGHPPPLNSNCAQSGFCNGATPNTPALSTSVIQSWYSNGFQNYLAGAGGGSGAQGTVNGGGPGSSGGFGIYIQAATITPGDIIAHGQSLPFGSSLTNCGGTGGGGVVVLAYSSGLGSISSIDVKGGTNSPNQCEGEGNLQIGGNGQVALYNYGSTPPIPSSGTTGSGTTTIVTSTTITTSTVTTSTTATATTTTTTTSVDSTSVLNAISSLRETLLNAIALTQNTIVNAVSGAQSAINSAIASAQSKLEGSISAATSTVTAAISSAVSALQGDIASSQAAIISAISGAQNAIQTSISNSQKAIISAIASSHPSLEVKASQPTGAIGHGLPITIYLQLNRGDTGVAVAGATVSVTFIDASTGGTWTVGTVTDVGGGTYSVVVTPSSNLGAGTAVFRVDAAITISSVGFHGSTLATVTIT